MNENAPIMWGEEEVNLPPKAWFKGEWYMEKRMREMREAKMRKIETAVQGCLIVCLVAGIVAICYLFGGM